MTQSPIAKITKKARLKRKAPVKLTSGRGFGFEDAVAARLLVDMLVGGNSFGADFGRVCRVDWQTRDVGWLTDDLVISFRTATGSERAAGISVKSDRQITEKGFPEDFVRIAWSQWLNVGTNRVFRQGADALALATSDLAPRVKKAWNDLTADITNVPPERIVARLANPTPDEGVQASKQKRVFFAGFECPADLKANAGNEIEERAALLQSVHVLNPDFDSNSSADEVAAIRDCQAGLVSGTLTQARDLWDRLISVAARYRQTGGGIDLQTLLRELDRAFQLREHPDFARDWETLNRRTDETLASVGARIDGTVHIPRDEQQREITDSLSRSRAAFLIGESGSGKSAIAKEVSAGLFPSRIWLRAADLDFASASDLERHFGLRNPLNSILRNASRSTLVVIDGVEGFSKRALSLLAAVLREIATDDAYTHVSVLHTVQADAASATMRELLRLGVPAKVFERIPLDRPSDEELRTVLHSVPQLRWLAHRADLRPVLSNLKILDWSARLVGSEMLLGDRPRVGLTSFMDLLWEDWAQGGNEGYSRSHLLQTIAIKEADALTDGTPRIGLDHAAQQAVHDAELGGFVRVSDERVSLVHDLLGDVARMRVLVGEGPAGAPIARAGSPAWHKAIRLFAQRLLEQSSDGIETWHRTVEAGSRDGTPFALVRDLFVEALFLGPASTALIEKAWPFLAANGGELLRKMLYRFLFVATLPDARLAALVDDPDDVAQLEHAFRFPYAPYWGPMLEVLYEHAADVVKYAPTLGARICSLWLNTTPFELAPGQPTPWRRKAAELALEIGREAHARNEEDVYFGGDDSKPYEAMLLAAHDFPDEVGQLCLELSKRRDVSEALAARVAKARQESEKERRGSNASRLARRMASVPSMPLGDLLPPWPDGPRNRVDTDFRKACLDTNAYSVFTRSNPDVALEVLLAVCIEAPKYEDLYGGSMLEDFGTAYWPGGEPAAYFRGPFYTFLQVAPEQGLSFVLRLVNFATARVAPDIRTTFEIEETEKIWLGDYRAFRWHHDWPMWQGSIVQCSLMALERWLFDQIKAGIDIAAVIRRIMAESTSVAFAGMLMDIGKMKPELFLGPMRPLLYSWELWNLDYELMIMRRSRNLLMPGYWGRQPRLATKLASDWFYEPFRHLSLLGMDGVLTHDVILIPKNSQLFDEVRAAWRAHIGEDGEPNALRYLVERLSPSNYTVAEDGKVTNFQWPPSLAEDNEEELRELAQRQQLLILPFRFRQLLDKGVPLPADQLLSFWEWLNEFADKPSDGHHNDGDAIHSASDLVAGSVAVLVGLNLDWLKVYPERLKWCRDQLASISDNPPSLAAFESPNSVGEDHWDAFLAEAGVKLLADDATDALARRLVAQGICSFHYTTTALTIRRSFQRRDKLGADFLRLIHLAVEWAALREIMRCENQARQYAQVEPEHVGEENALITSFIDQSLIAAIPDFSSANVKADSTLQVISKKQWPRRKDHARFRSNGNNYNRSNNLYPKWIGLDFHVLKASFGWLDVAEANTPAERAEWLSLIRRLLKLLLETLPKIDNQLTEPVDGLPHDFEAWVYELLALNIPKLTLAEAPDQLWIPIFDLGPAAHEWVERFFWAWFTTGFQAVSSLSHFVALWRRMITYALDHPFWNPEGGHNRLDGMVVELLGFNTGWATITRDESNALVVATLVDLYGRAARQWFGMKDVVRGFLFFAVRPGASKFLLPAIGWLSGIVPSYGKYAWGHGMEDAFVEYLRVCWTRESVAILASPELKADYLTLLSTAVAGGSHAATALRDLVARSTAF